MEYDFCNPEGARRLKQRIEEYWRDRGYNVDIKLIEAGFVAAMRSARTDVRSDMVNGMPRVAGSTAKRPAPPADSFVEDFDNSDDDLVFE